MKTLLFFNAMSSAWSLRMFSRRCVSWAARCPVWEEVLVTLCHVDVEDRLRPAAFTRGSNSEANQSSVGPLFFPVAYQMAATKT
ncbi:hypothetical protein C8R43DRAFT_1018015 [Mycena crocata]|nr:hypothetical protein C8R43DRAFT_1018015 [Mycena crocata]